MGSSSHVRRARRKFSCEAGESADTVVLAAAVIASLYNINGTGGVVFVIARFPVELPLLGLVKAVDDVVEGILGLVAHTWTPGCSREQVSH